jgi:hypothetical protein
MKVIKSYINGASLAFRSLRMTTALYILNLVVALVLIVPFYKSLVSIAGNSIAYVDMVRHFDYTAWTELMREAGKLVPYFIKSVGIIAILFFLLNILINGAILSILTIPDQRFQMPVFLSGGAQWFGKFLGVSLLFLLFQVVIAVIIYLVLGILLGAVLKSGFTEKTVVSYVIPAVALHLIIFIFLWMTSWYTRIILFSGELRHTFRSVWRAFRFAFRKIFRTYALALMLLLIPLALMIIFFLLKKIIGMQSTMAILVVLLIQQAFIWFRNLIHIWTIGSLLNSYPYPGKTE